MKREKDENEWFLSDKYGTMSLFTLALIKALLSIDYTKAESILYILLFYFTVPHITILHFAYLSILYLRQCPKNLIFTYFNNLSLVASKLSPI